MLYVTNSFLLNMVENFDHVQNLKFIRMTKEQVVAVLRHPRSAWSSAIGHADTAAILSSELGVEIPFARISVSMKKDDRLLVCQYRGERLPEGCTTLPEGACMEYVFVSISE